MKVLLPIDSPADAQLVIGFVCKYQWPKNTEFKVLHILGTSQTDDAAQTAEAEAFSLLCQMTAKVEQELPLAKVVSEVKSGSPILEILSEATKWEAEMIVMGYRSRDNVNPYAMGSVSNGVAVQAPCSVAIIRPSKNIYKRKADNEAVEPEKRAKHPG
jgi:nucleotide-binding universal stress UspA family protein